MMANFMQLAFRLAKKADPFPNPRVGAVLVKDGEVIGTGYHKKAGEEHAEINAINDAKQKGKKVEGSTFYVTLEPCSHTNKRTPPCTGAIIANKIKKVVFAMKDPNPLVDGRKKLKEAGVIVVGPINEKKARTLNKKYLKNIARKTFVAIKMAMSADGKTATKTGDSKWITGENARKFVHKLRSEFDAVMVGAGTVKKDNPRLTARIKDGRNPYRIIIDSDLCILINSNVFGNGEKTIVITTEKASRKKRERMGKKAQIFVCGKKEVDLKKAILGLQAMGIRKILIEGGSELNAGALKAGIVDKLYLFIAPKIIGGRTAKGVVGGDGIKTMEKALKLKNRKTTIVGYDVLMEFDIERR
ncbi:bifunctional diaminohydroxyphosphoribosylaminopyrimidine deaminase/5-amino-6-(5-phosphoribosylamino)uracil reductase RibD [Candidatus Micrarchaeota archaeon]|nr:bifunctional diaminohydroxyphosphoribosylaminopyrimidine deaminase/5-amino-6-(5-phosphoribosylamino)uracil reductase RibD [Candidatus Micrarchaeota archaeon]